MKTAVVLALVGSSLAAPTSTIKERQFGTSSGFGSLTSLLADSGSSSSLGSSLSGTGTTSGLGSLSSLLADSGLGSSSGTETTSGLGSLSSLLASSGLSSSTGTGTTSGLGSLSSLLADSGSSSSFSGLSGLRKFKRATVSSTMNGVTENTTCEPLTLIFARGTDETGNMGTIVGPPLATKLQSLTDSKVTIQGVNYDASVAGDATMGEDGGSDMATLVKTALSNCPNTKVVLGGYSEGAMVVHNAASSLTADQVAAAVLFGDPLKAESVGKLSTSDVKEFCATGDPVCENGENVMAHLSYGSDATEAAEFLIKAAGISTSS
ncbi:cutinase-domain-containing protein [Penicillium frequentans]|nr:cutinase-domain-containing protein [Penicillium glabrum]